MTTDLQQGLDMLRESGLVIRKNLVEVTIAVPLDEIDFTDCEVHKDFVKSSFWGDERTDPEHDVDLTGAKWRGEEVTFSDTDYAIAQQYLIEERASDGR